MKLGKKIISYILIGICITSAIFLTISFLIKWNLLENTIMKHIKNNDLSFILKDKNGTETKYLEETKEALKKIGIPSETINAVVNSEATVNFIGKYTAQIFNYLIYETGNITINKEDILLLAEQNFPVIERVLKEKDIPFTKEQQELINSLIEKHQNNIMDLFPSVKRLINKLENKTFILYEETSLLNIVHLLEKLTNKTLIYALILLGCSSIIFLFLIERKKISKWLKTSLLCYAFFFIGVEVFLGTILKKYVLTEWESANEILNYFINCISQELWVFILVGLLLSGFFCWYEKKKLVSQKESDII